LEQSTVCFEVIVPESGFAKQVAHNKMMLKNNIKNFSILIVVIVGYVR